MLEKTILSSIFILLVLIVRKIFDGKVSPMVQYALWLPVILRLLLPGTIINSELSIMNIFSLTDRDAQYSEELMIDTEDNLYHTQVINIYDALTKEEGTGEAETGDNGTEGLNPLNTSNSLNASDKLSSANLMAGDVFKDRLWRLSGLIIKVVVYLGMIGTSVVFLWRNLDFYIYLKNTRRELTTVSVSFMSSMETTNTLKVYVVGDRLASPCLFGLRPSIYIPERLTCSEDLSYILSHEKTHYRHLDHIWGVIRIICLILNWYNPLVWIAAKYSVLDSELFCDADCIRNFSDEERVSYGEALLKAVIQFPGNGNLLYGATMMGSGKHFMKKRIEKIASSGKYKFVFVAMLVLFVLACMGITFTGADRSRISDGDQNSVADNTLPDIDDSTVPEANEPNGWNDENSDGNQNTCDDYEWEYDSVKYVVKGKGTDGIYRITDGVEEHIYTDFVGFTPNMHICGNKLFFATERNYSEGDLDWMTDSIKWIDLTTLESGDVDLASLTQSGILNYSIVEGVIGVETGSSDNWRYAPLALKGETVFNGKCFDELSESDADDMGSLYRQQLLQNPGTIYNISYWVPGGSSAYLDIDGDGTAEKIFISVDWSTMQNHGGIYSFRLNVNDAYIDSYSENVSNNIYALSPDGETILLMLYADGPSADPETFFFRYRSPQENNNGSIFAAGTFETDCRMGRPAENGITAPVYRNGWDWHMVDIHIAFNDETGMMEEVPQDIYDYSSLTAEEYYYELGEELALHTAPDSSETVTIMPQHIKFKQITSDRKWFSIEGEDGTTGWIALDETITRWYGMLPEVGKTVEEVFSEVYPRAG